MMARGTQYRKQFFKGSIASALLLVLGGLSSANATDTQERAVETSAAKSLQTILKQAEEQGLLRPRGAVIKAPEGQVFQSKAIHLVEDLDFLSGEIDCADADVFNLSENMDTTSFDAVFEGKNKTQRYETADGILPLSKTYFALGLGAEVVALTRGLHSPKALLMQSTARIIDDQAVEIDHKIVEKFSKCSRDASFWNTVSLATKGGSAGGDALFDLSIDETKRMEDLPPILKDIIVTRLGIYAAEQGSKRLAEKLLLMVEPKSIAKKTIEVKTDERLYLFALIRSLKNDPMGRKILTYLGQRDGVYRTRALNKLSELNSVQGAELYEEFSNDLLAVKQQYKGQKQAREAVVEIIRQKIKQDKFVETVNLAKKEFSLEDAERVVAITIIADKITERLVGDDQKARLFALNGYLHDAEFFAAYVNFKTLNQYAFNAALDLNLPDLALSILSDDEEKREAVKADRAYAQARADIKNEDYRSVVDSTKAFAKNEKFEALRLQAALALADGKETSSLLKSKPVDAVRNNQEAHVAWRNSEWRDAQASLTAAAEATDDNHIKTQLAVATYMANSDAEAMKSVPETADALGEFKDGISGDISTIRAYLSDG